MKTAFKVLIVPVMLALYVAIFILVLAGGEFLQEHALAFVSSFFGG